MVISKNTSYNEVTWLLCLGAQNGKGESKELQIRHTLPLYKHSIGTCHNFFSMKRAVKSSLPLKKKKGERDIRLKPRGLISLFFCIL